jgi:diadenosine tetraphosphate (Ap4A) HIT family hydrolase
MSFKLHQQLAQDTHHLGDFPLSTLLLSKDANYPWFILVPRRNEIREAFQLTTDEQAQLHQESIQLGQALHLGFKADKMNIAALGNMVPQLHIHHIVRYTNDPAWPNPVWGFTDVVPYTADTLEKRISDTLEALQALEFTPAI